jgi:hypothetical protein
LTVFQIEEEVPVAIKSVLQPEVGRKKNPQKEVAEMKSSLKK